MLLLLALLRVSRRQNRRWAHRAHRGCLHERRGTQQEERCGGLWPLWALSRRKLNPFRYGTKDESRERAQWKRPTKTKGSS
eukprot:scaffold1596_cov302-Pinguiococcus_pyrenoidosus.AAC.69